MSSFDITIASLDIMSMIVKNLYVDTVRCKSAMSEDLYTTEKALKLVKTGIPFRDAYRMVGEKK